MGVENLRWAFKSLVDMGVLDGCKWVGMGIEAVLELIWMA